MAQLLDDGLGQDPHLLLVFDDENHSHGPCPTLYASAPTEREHVLFPECRAHRSIAVQPGARLAADGDSTPCRAVRSGTKGARKNPAVRGSSLGGNAHD